MTDWNDTTSRLTPGSIYRANRAAGMPARYALNAARYITATLDTLEGFTAEFPSSDSLDATFSTEDTNAGVSITYEIHRDYDVTPEDAECYSPEDIAAWKADEWHYYWISVTATMGRFSVTETLGGIDAGDYWESAASPLDTEQQVMSVALEHFSPRGMIDAVQAEAIAACLQPSPAAATSSTEG